MTMIADRVHRAVWAGVDTHRDEHVAAVVDSVGTTLGVRAFPASSSGYVALIGWVRDHGQLIKVGIEGTGAYGAGLQRYAHSIGIECREIDRPDRKRRRGHAKSDATDAIAAAVACRSGERVVHPKMRDGAVEALRNLRIAHRSAVSQRADCQRRLRCVILTAPSGLRERLEDKTLAVLIRECASLRADCKQLAEPTQAVKIALRLLARRHQQLTIEIKELDQLLKQLVCTINAPILTPMGVGVEVAGQLLVTAGQNPERLKSAAAFAALCGASPIAASSGQTRRHRLNRGGDRQANRALHTITLVRMQRCDRTKAYVKKRTTEGLSKREIMRCLKTYIAREMYHHLIA